MMLLFQPNKFVLLYSNTKNFLILISSVQIEGIWSRAEPRVTYKKAGRLVLSIETVVTPIFVLVFQNSYSNGPNCGMYSLIPILATLTKARIEQN